MCELHLFLPFLHLSVQLFLEEHVFPSFLYLSDKLPTDVEIKEMENTEENGKTCVNQTYTDYVCLFPSTASHQWRFSEQQHDLKCDFAFIQKFQKLYLGLNDSNKENKITTCLFNHLFLRPCSGKSGTAVKMQRTPFISNEPTVVQLLLNTSTTFAADFRDD